MSLSVTVHDWKQVRTAGRALSFLEAGMADMVSCGVSRILDSSLLFNSDQNYLLSCIDGDGVVCGVFAVSIGADFQWRDCFVTIAYTDAARRRQGIFRTLLQFTAAQLPGLAGRDFDTISFGVHDCNYRMQAVMQRCGCEFDGAFLCEDATYFKVARATVLAGMSSAGEAPVAVGEDVDSYIAA